jgi:hypothetical protein
MWLHATRTLYTNFSPRRGGVGWTGQALLVPRSRVAELRDWPEASRPGVYLLLGEDESGTPAAYIGESENVRDRIAAHLRAEEYDFAEVILFTSKDENLTKSHVKFLEGRMHEHAVSADRYAIWNNSTPATANLPRPDAEAMNEFLDNLKLLVRTIGCTLFTPAAEAVPQIGPLPELTMSCPDLGVQAKGRQTDEGFLVSKDSQATKQEAAQLGQTYKNLRQNLVSKQVLLDAGVCYVFTEDHLFTSSSAAAAVVAGSNRSGPQTWKNAEGQSLRDIEAGGLAATASQSE